MISSSLYRFPFMGSLLIHRRFSAWPLFGAWMTVAGQIGPRRPWAGAGSASSGTGLRAAIAACERPAARFWASCSPAVQRNLTRHRLAPLRRQSAGLLHGPQELAAASGRVRRGFGHFLRVLTTTRYLGYGGTRRGKVITGSRTRQGGRP